MAPQDIFWQAQWIASTVRGGPRTTAPAPHFRKTFPIKGSLRKAVLHVTALGLYECEINGARVGNQAFAPGWTDYHKRVHFQSHEVTALLTPGENVLGAILGDGWYCGFLGWGNRQFYGDRPRLLAQLELTADDGTVTRVVSDATWKTATGPILESDLLLGETYDARLSLGAWSSPGYSDAAWSPIVVEAAPGMAMEPSPGPIVREMGTLPVVREMFSGPGWNPTANKVYDLGQNFTGRVRIKVRAARGSTILLRHAEVLNPDGSLYTENLRTARATDTYTCAGGGEETWEPRFTFHGFRYVEIQGLAKDESCELTGVVLHSDTPPTGRFQCSHPLLNQLAKNIVWGQKSNFLEVPTDCPQRDERLGWTGDAQVFIRTACFNMDVRTFFHKWLRDMRDAQLPDGAIPIVVPNAFKPAASNDGGPAWADAVFICPWTLYLCYGDTGILHDHYDCMARYMEFLAAHKVKQFIRCHPDIDSWGGYGDWLALDSSGFTEGGTAKDLIGTAMYANDADLMARIAGLLGKEEDARRYRQLHGDIVAAFRRRFVTPDGLVTGGTQTAHVLALHFGLVPEEGRANAAKELVRLIERNGRHLGTGFVGTPYLLDVLEKSGHLDIAYALLEQETFPSWLFPVKNGATTIWERWDGWTPEKGFQDKGMNSFNHYAYGAVGAWMVSAVAGLELDPEEPGYRHIFFKPRPGGSIAWAEARLATPQGEAGIRWDLQGEALKLDLLVPPGSRASLRLPTGFSGAPDTLAPGRHVLTAARTA